MSRSVVASMLPFVVGPFSCPWPGSKTQSPLRVAGSLGCQWCIRPKSVIKDYVQTCPWTVAVTEERAERQFGTVRDCKERGETWPSHGGEPVATRELMISAML